MRGDIGVRRPRRARPSAVRLIGSLVLALGLLSPVVTRATDSATPSLVLGTVEPDYNFPWIVKVQGTLACHGTLIAEWWVLTAAHCVSNRFGGVTVTYTRTTPDGIPTNDPPLQTGPNSVVVHPDYDPFDFHDDIALVKLPRRFTANPFLQAAALPVDAPGIGQQGTVAAPTSTPGMAAVLRGPIVLTGPRSFSVKSPTASLCPGDSGSGFVVQAGGRHVVLGVVANTPTSNDCTQPGWEFEAMSVHAYAEWIRAYTALVDRSAEYGTPPAASPPTAVVIPGLGVHNIAYRDTSGQLHELWRDTLGATGTTNLTANAEAPRAAGNPFAYIDTLRHTEILLFRAGDGTVRSLYWSTGAVGHDNLSGGYPRAAGDPVGYYEPAADTHHVIYRAGDGHLYELYWTGVAPVYGGNLTGPIAAPRAAGEPTVFIAAGVNMVVYRSVYDQILSLYWTDGPTGLDDLSGYAGTPPAAGDPVAYYTAHDDTYQVVYCGTDGHLWEIYGAGVAPVVAWDLTAAAGAPAAVGTPAAYYSAGTRTKHVVYRAADGGLHEIRWVPGGGTPAHVDLTAAYGAPPAADDPAAFTVEGPNTQHVTYRGTDRHIYEVRW
jgi:Trypsin